ncbi:MAG: helix-turn-helix domain-containing protein [Burkholderiaceae bacterium]|nr:helix-turn-helix domain-containing protein [Burkholderiaceae bacterium]
MKRDAFDTTTQPREARVDYWEQSTRQYFGPLGTTNLAPDDAFEATMLVYHAGPLRLYTIDASAHRIVRDHSEMGDAADNFKLLLQLRGESEIEQRDACVTLKTGDWSLYDPRVPYSITSGESLKHMVVHIPRERLRPLSVPPLHTCEPAEPELRGLYSVLSSFLASLSSQLDSLPDGCGSTISEATLALLASTLQARRGGQPEATPLPEVLRLRVRQYIDSNLADADLTIERIARDLRCSKRYLHRVFEGEDATVERYIWRARLLRCKQALERPESGGRSISGTAYHWGFNSVAHFSRLFKAEFGVTPSAFVRSRRH